MHNGLPYSTARTLFYYAAPRSEPTSNPRFLAPATTWTATQLLGQVGKSHSRGRRFTSTKADPTSDRHDTLPAVQPQSQSQSQESSHTSSLPQWPRFGDVSSWVKVLDSYLPPNLRSDDMINRLAIFDGVRSVVTLPETLMKAKTSPKLQLLSYIGVEQGRWEAVLWLVKAMLEKCGPITTRDEEHLWIMQSSWVKESPLDELTSAAIWSHLPERPNRVLAPSLDMFTEPSPGGSVTHGADFRRSILAQVWYSAGCMVLEAADSSEAKAKIIMTHVYQILAHLHHVGAIANTIYNYSPTIDPSALQRPPTLHLLSSRILCTLSDAVWRAQEREVRIEAASVGAEYVYKGHEVPEARYKIRVRELGTEVWLELILWSCIEDGFITSAADIISDMEGRKGSRKWSVINWDSTRASPSSYSQKRAWDRVGITGVEGYSEAPPLVEMGPRTISSEVVAALIDGLVSTSEASGQNNGNSPSSVWEHINICKNLLNRRKYGLESSSWNSIILRMLESGSFDPEAEPGVMERILDFAPIYKQEVEASNSPDAPGSSAQSYVAEYSAAALGLLHRTLLAYSRQGNLQGALRTFKQLQALVDDNRKHTIKEFLNKARAESEDEDGIQEIAEAATPETFKSVNTPAIDLQLPPSTLAVLLDLITDSKLYDFGNWFLYTHDVDGRVIPSSLYSKPNLQPALLRFALATSNKNLLEAVVRNMETPLSEPHLRALLQCQIDLGKWVAVEELLKYLRDEAMLGWSVSDIMLIAKSVLKFEAAKVEGQLDIEAKSRSERILEKLLRGEYDPLSDPSQPRDFSRRRLLNQVGRILTSASSKLASISSRIPPNNVQAQATTSIPTEAFNILLEAVVEIFGSIEGKRLWDLWCRKPLPLSSDIDEVEETKQTFLATPASQDAPVLEKVVRPDLNTVRIIMRHIVQAREDVKHKSASIASERENKPPVISLSQSDKALLNWAGSMFRAFGLSNPEIHEELQGHYYRNFDLRSPESSK